MSRLTVTEKEHWKVRIERRINKAIQALEIKDVTLMPSIYASADAETHQLLGTLAFHERIEAIKRQEKQLEQEKKQLEGDMYRQGLGKGPDSPHQEWQMSREFWEHYRNIKAGIEERLLGDHPVGRDILKLKGEKDALLDTVWLATSSAQIRDLWAQVSEILGESSTPLQQQIMGQTASDIAQL